MTNVEEYLEKENLHSSWIRNMFQMITMGIILLTFFQEHTKLTKHRFIPIIIIILGIIIGLYSVYFTYYTDINSDELFIQKHYAWKYISIVTCVVFIFVAFYIIRYYK